MPQLLVAESVSYISPWGEKSYGIEYATEPRTNHGGDDRMFENRAIFSNRSS